MLVLRCTTLRVIGFHAVVDSCLDQAAKGCFRERLVAEHHEREQRVAEVAADSGGDGGGGGERDGEKEKTDQAVPFLIIAEYKLVRRNSI